MLHRLLPVLLFLAVMSHADPLEYFNCIINMDTLVMDQDTLYEFSEMKAVYLDGYLRGSVTGIALQTYEPYYEKKEKAKVLPGVFYKDVRVKVSTDSVMRERDWGWGSESLKYEVFWHYEDFAIPLTKKELNALKRKSVPRAAWDWIEPSKTKYCLDVHIK